VSFQAEGVLKKVFDVEQKSERFQAREFVIETEEQYPQFVKFQLVQDKCNLIDEHNEGDRLKVSFDLRGREWNGKYFTNLHAWKIETADGSGSGSASGGGSSQGAPAPQSAPAATKTATPPQADFDDDIPF